MPLLGNIGRRIASNMPNSATLPTIGLAVAGAAYGIASSNPIEQYQNFLDDTLLGTRDADIDIMGRNISIGSFINPFGNPATALPRAMKTGTVLGGLGGLLTGSGLRSRAIRGAVGAFGGGLLGGAAGIANMLPYINGTTIGMAFNDDVGYEAALRAAEDNAAAGFNVSGAAGSNMLYAAEIEHQGNMGPDYYGYDFVPNNAGTRRSRRRNTGATGDMVFGMYNLRTR